MKDIELYLLEWPSRHENIVCLDPCRLAKFLWIFVSREFPLYEVAPGVLLEDVPLCLGSQGKGGFCWAASISAKMDLMLQCRWLDSCLGWRRGGLSFDSFQLNASVWEISWSISDWLMSMGNGEGGKEDVSKVDEGGEGKWVNTA